jgi:hypothetical protein
MNRLGSGSRTRISTFRFWLTKPAGAAVAPGRAVDPLGDPVIASDVMTSRGLLSGLLSDPRTTLSHSCKPTKTSSDDGCKAARLANILQICLLFVVGHG